MMARDEMACRASEQAVRAAGDVAGWPSGKASSSEPVAWCVGGGGGYRHACEEGGSLCGSGSTAGRAVPW